MYCMSTLDTVNVLNNLPGSIQTYVFENVDDEFLIGYRIPDALFNSRCTWFVLFERQLVVVDSAKPFRVLDRFYIGDLSAETVEVEGSEFVRVYGEEMSRDVYIQFDSSESKSTVFSSVITEQVNALEEVKDNAEEFQFTF